MIIFFVILNVALAVEPFYLAQPIGDPAMRVIEGAIRELETKLGDQRILTADKSARKLSVEFGKIPGGPAGRAHLGWDGNCHIQIYEKLDLRFVLDPPWKLRSDLRQTFLHELGHCFKIWHSTDRHDVMYPVVEPAVQESSASFARLVERIRRGGHGP